MSKIHPLFRKLFTSQFPFGLGGTHDAITMEDIRAWQAAGEPVSEDEPTSFDWKAEAKLQQHRAEDRARRITELEARVHELEGVRLGDLMPVDRKAIWNGCLEEVLMRTAGIITADRIFSIIHKMKR